MKTRKQLSNRTMRFLLIYLFFGLASTAQAQFQTSTDNGAVSITKYVGPGGSVNVPAIIDSHPVCTIGFGAFSGCRNLTSVTVPQTVTNIGEVAFSDCINLNSIKVDPLNPVFSSLDGVLFNKDQTALIECPGGKAGSYRVPDSVETIQDNAFSELYHITSISVPDNVSTIEWHAFYSCFALTNITIGTGVDVIGDDDTSWLPLSGCSSLLMISIAPGNRSFTSVDGVLFNKEKTRLIKYPEGKSGSYAIPDGVTTIGSHAFSGATHLASVTVPDSVNSIEDYAFETCNGLTNVMLGKGIAKIGNAAFLSYTRTIPISVDPSNPFYGSKNGVLVDKRKFLTESPVVAIKEPGNNSSINAMWVDLSGTFKAKNLKQIFIQSLAANMEIPATIKGNNFEARNVFLRPGTNMIFAIAEDADGDTGTNIIAVNGPADDKTAKTLPVRIQAIPIGGFAPLKVTFNVQASVPGKIQKVTYDFTGDGTSCLTSSDLKPVTHTYDSGQFFPVVTIQTDIGRFSSLSGMFGMLAMAFGSDNGPALVNVQAPPILLSKIKIEDPVDIKWTANSNLYVLSGSTAAITEFDAAGNPIRSIKGIGTRPSGFDVDGDGNVYAAVPADNEVKKFKPTDDSFELDASFGDNGAIGPGLLNAPFDVKLSGDGQTIVVSDSGSGRIQSFTLKGAAQPDSARNLGNLKAPSGLTKDDYGYWFIVDSGTGRIVLGDPGLGFMFLGASGTNGAALGQFSGALHLSASKRGLYVADTGNDRVQVFSGVEIGKEGLSPTPFNPRVAISGELGLKYPESVAAVDDLLEEKLYIADTGNNRVVLVKLPLDNPEIIWKHMIGRLKAGDVPGAMSDFSIESKEKYQEAYQSLSRDDLIAMVKGMEDIKPVTIESDQAQYYFDSVVQGKTLTFPIEFDKEFGQWKIVEF